MSEPTATRAGRNVLGEPLQPCSTDPLTGFYRDGCCRTGPEDVGLHTVCAVMTEDFLAFSKARLVLPPKKEPQQVEGVAAVGCESMRPISIHNCAFRLLFGA